MLSKILQAVGLVAKYVEENRVELEQQFNEGKKLVEEIQAIFKEESSSETPSQPSEPTANAVMASRKSSNQA